MHDPKCVAFEVSSLVPSREEWRERTLGGKRWGWVRTKWTGPDDVAGTPRWPWWRPCCWNLVAAGRLYGLGTLATVWHKEPGGIDAGHACKHSRRTVDGRRVPDRRWMWHVHHWSVQVHFWQQFRHRFVRCAGCGRRMNTAGRFSYMGSTKVWHYECQSLLHAESQRRQLLETMSRMCRFYEIDSAEDLMPVVTWRAEEGEDTFPLWYLVWSQLVWYNKQEPADRWRSTNQGLLDSKKERAARRDGGGVVDDVTAAGKSGGAE